MIKKLTISIIPHYRQRYNTIGDYVEESPGDWKIIVSDVDDWRMAMLIAFHEMAELIQTESSGIPEPDIKAFDERFGKTNPGREAEPGEQPDAPYHKQHVFAECLERLLAAQLGISWQEYEKKVMEVCRR